MSTEPFAIRLPANPSAVTLGEHQALIIDDFLLAPEAMRSAALAAEFSQYPGYENKKGYPGIRAIAPYAYSVNLTLFLEPLLKAFFNVPTELDIRKSVCAFSLTTMTPQELGPLQRTPHFDASTPHHLAVLLYLCGEEHGGTAFYRHNATGIQRLTAENREHYLDVYYEEINRRRPAMRYFDESDEQFTRVGFIPAKFNRLVAYRGSLLHSACINPKLSIGTDPRVHRLTVNTFYDF